MNIEVERKKEIENQIKEMMENCTSDIIKSIDTALRSGAIDDKDPIITDKGNYVFAKLLITLYFNKYPYLPPTKSQNRRLLKNLEHFI